jgi:hypothetical protein
MGKRERGQGNRGNGEKEAEGAYQHVGGGRDRRSRQRRFRGGGRGRGGGGGDDGVCPCGWVGRMRLEVGFRLRSALYMMETRSKSSDRRSTVVKSWTIWAACASLLIIFLFLFLFSFYCTIVK